MARFSRNLLALLALSTTAVALTLPNKRDTSCACGYQDSNGNVWREAIISTFTQSEGALAAVNQDWVIATDNQPQTVGPQIAIQYTTANVVQYNDALGLKVSPYDGSGSINSAEIFTQRQDIKYGTFRMRAVVPTVQGVVFGFFTYISDTQEQDIEFLSSETDYYQRVHYTNHPGQLNGDTDPDAAKNVVIPGADFTAFGEHRIDWLPAQTKYYYNGAQTSSITKNVPTTPSQVIINAWSNGDPNFSQGPPTSEAIATVQYAHLYFNSTAYSEQDLISSCAAAGHIAKCQI